MHIIAEKKMMVECVLGRNSVIFFKILNTNSMCQALLNTEHRVKNSTEEVSLPGLCFSNKDNKQTRYLQIDKCHKGNKMVRESN